MDFWNKANFEGLQALSVELRAREGLGPLADYCRLREAGLRREAFAALDSFLDGTTTWSPSQAQEAVDAILALYFQTRDCHQFLVQPLEERFVLPVLYQWEQREPDSTTPVRWLGFLTRKPQYLRKVLAANPGDIEVRRLLIERHLSHLDHATHHLGESLFLGELDDAMDDLACATSLMEAAPDRNTLADLEGEVHEFGRMLSDWRAYSADPAGSFPEWCSARGRRYTWPTSVYYSKGSA